MDNNQHCEEKCELKIHPCNFKVEIKEINPFYTSSCVPLVLDLRVIDDCCFDSCIKIKCDPLHGKVYKIGPSTLIYKACKDFCGLDMFQILVENETGCSHIESILVCVK